MFFAQEASSAVFFLQAFVLTLTYGIAYLYPVTIFIAVTALFRRTRCEQCQKNQGHERESSHGKPLS